VPHAGGLLFQCLVATGNGAPVAAVSVYALAIQRQAAAGPAEPSAQPGALATSGLAGSE